MQGFLTSKSSCVQVPAKFCCFCFICFILFYFIFFFGGGEGDSFFIPFFFSELVFSLFLLLALFLGFTRFCEPHINFLVNVLKTLYLQIL